MLNEKEWYDSLFSFTGLKQSVFWQWIFTLNSIFCSRSKLVASFCLLSNSSVIRQKGESRKECFRKTKRIKFSKKRTFLTPWYAHVRVCTCAYQGVKNVRFFGKFGVLCILVTSALWFAFFSYYRRNLLSHAFLLPKSSFNYIEKLPRNISRYVRPNIFYQL